MWYFCFPCRVDISHVLWVCCVVVLEKTQYLYKFSKFVILLPSLVFHTGGMFVILINVSIFRMSQKKSLYILKLSSDSCQGSSVFGFWVTFKLTWVDCILLKIFSCKSNQWLVASVMGLYMFRFCFNHCIMNLSSLLEVKFLSSLSIRMQIISKYKPIQYTVQLYCISKCF